MKYILPSNVYFAYEINGIHTKKSTVMSSVSMITIIVFIFFRLFRFRSSFNISLILLIIFFFIYVDSFQKTICNG